MISFFFCLITLICGYFVYGAVIDKVFGPDDRQTPVLRLNDGVDFVELPTWRMFLIQLLNIAGLGPIWGAVIGAMWGPCVFLWITFGTLLIGGVHDYASGFISLRNDGKSMNELTSIYMGNKVRKLMSVFVVLLLFIVGVVFSNAPAELISFLVKKNISNQTSFLTSKYFWLTVIFAYYFIATFLPIDKIIGKIYPLFGISLLIMAVGVGIGIFTHGYKIPEIQFKNMHPSNLPIWTNMFIMVACGAISGFHATQSPLMARCCKNEKMSRKIFYGAMICESVIALIWAAAGCALYPIVGGKMIGLAEVIKAGQASCIYEISLKTMGTVGAVLAVFGVIACPITTGDTALRSARLAIADAIGLDQKNTKNRLLSSLVIILLCAICSQLPFSSIWNYLMSTNQVLATICLWVPSCYLVKTGNKNWWITAVPATFMSIAISSFIYKSPLYFGHITSKIGNMEILGNIFGFLVGITFAVLFLKFVKKNNSLSNS